MLPGGFSETVLLQIQTFRAVWALLETETKEEARSTIELQGFPILSPGYFHAYITVVAKGRGLETERVKKKKKEAIAQLP